MKKSVLLSIALMFVITISKAQTTAMQFSGVDCNSNPVDLFADLDAGKAVILHFYMPSCGSCPPPAQKIQAMANNINAQFPGMVKGYAFPFQNSTTCTYSSSWVSSNNLGALYAPMDSGAAHVAHYGGFGMPSVVLLGGLDHRVMFFTMGFSTSDTTLMRDSILNLFNSTGINVIQNSVSEVSMYPNPANDKVQLEINVDQSSDLKIEVINLLGEVVANVFESKSAKGILKKEISVATLNNGTYFFRVNANGKSQNYKFTVAH